MSARLVTILCSILILVCLIAVSYSVTRLSTAQKTLDSQLRALQEVADLTSEISSLRLQEQRVEQISRPEQDVIARVNAVLSNAGLPKGRFSGLVPESDVAVQTRGASSSFGPKLRRQTVRLALQDLAVTELGQFLVNWRQFNPMWTMARIDLSHRMGRESTGNQYDVMILLSALYLADQEPST